jgi:hypothetical protein
MSNGKPRDEQWFTKAKAPKPWEQMLKTKVNNI